MKTLPLLVLAVTVAAVWGHPKPLAPSGATKAAVSAAKRSTVAVGVHGIVNATVNVNGTVNATVTAGKREPLQVNLDKRDDKDAKKEAEKKPAAKDAKKTEEKKPAAKEDKKPAAKDDKKADAKKADAKDDKKAEAKPADKAGDKKADAAKAGDKAADKAGADGKAAAGSAGKAAGKAVAKSGVVKPTQPEDLKEMITETKAKLNKLALQFGKGSQQYLVSLGHLDDMVHNLQILLELMAAESMADLNPKSPPGDLEKGEGRLHHAGHAVGSAPGEVHESAPGEGHESAAGEAGDNGESVHGYDGSDRGLLGLENKRQLLMKLKSKSTP